MDSTISVAQASVKLRKSYNQILREIFVGTLPGFQDPNGRWHVSAEAVERRVNAPPVTAA